MVEEYRKGYVYIQNKYAGIIAETDEGYTFVYDEEYLTDEKALPLSLTMPLQADAYQSNVLFPFFAGIRRSGYAPCRNCRNTDGSACTFKNEWEVCLYYKAY